MAENWRVPFSEFLLYQVAHRFETSGPIAQTCHCLAPLCQVLRDWQLHRNFDCLDELIRLGLSRDQHIVLAIEIIDGFDVR
jgi:hypothetical protein